MLDTVLLIAITICGNITPDTDRLYCLENIVNCHGRGVPVLIKYPNGTSELNTHCLRKIEKEN